MILPVRPRLVFALRSSRKGLRHRAQEADHQPVDLAAVGGEELHLPEIHDVVKIGEVGQPPAQPVDGFYDDDVELSSLCVLQQALVLRAKNGSAGDGGVGIRADDRPAECLTIAPAFDDLVLDRLGPLLV